MLSVSINFELILLAYKWMKDVSANNLIYFSLVPMTESSTLVNSWLEVFCASLPGTLFCVAISFPLCPNLNIYDHKKCWKHLFWKDIRAPSFFFFSIVWRKPKQSLHNSNGFLFILWTIVSFTTFQQIVTSWEWISKSNYTSTHGNITSRMKTHITQMKIHIGVKINSNAKVPKLTLARAG